jgi:hypothetical protein
MRARLAKTINLLFIMAKDCHGVRKKSVVFYSIHIIAEICLFQRVVSNMCWQYRQVLNSNFGLQLYLLLKI